MLWCSSQEKSSLNCLKEEFHKYWGLLPGLSCFWILKSFLQIQTDYFNSVNWSGLPMPPHPPPLTPYFFPISSYVHGTLLVLVLSFYFRSLWVAFLLLALETKQNFSCNLPAHWSFPSCTKIISIPFLIKTFFTFSFHNSITCSKSFNIALSFWPRAN